MTEKYRIAGVHDVDSAISVEKDKQRERCVEGFVFGVSWHHDGLDYSKGSLDRFPIVFCFWNGEAECAKRQIRSKSLTNAR